MKTTVAVNAGICGFKTKIEVEGDDEQNVTFRFDSECPKAGKFGEALMALGPVDGYSEIGNGSEGVVLTTARANIKGSCAACAVPIAAFKAMQVAAGLALPKEVTLQFDAGA